MSRRRDWVGALAAGGIALAASLTGLANGLVQDDAIVIAGNARLHDLAGWREILSTPFWPPPYSEYLYRPLTSLLLAAEYAAGDGSPWVFHLASALLYALVAAGVYLLAARLLPRGIALAIALLFAAHPVHVEAVALAVSQSELLVALSGLAMTVWYLDRRRHGAGVLRLRDWIFLGGLYLVACFSKEHGLMLPGLLLAAEYLLVPAPAWSRTRRLGPGFIGLAGVGICFVLARTAVLAGNLAGTFTAEALEGLSPGGRALTMLGVVPHWVRLLLWPAHLQADYSPEELVASTHLGGAELLGLGIVVGIGFTGWLLRRKAPVVTFGLVWAGLALLPVSNLIVPTGILLAERTLFLPSIGFLLGLGGLVALLPALMGTGAIRGTQRMLAVAATALVIAGVVRSARRERDWRSEPVLTERNAEDAPRSYRTQQAWGYLLFETGRREPALEAYRRAMDLAPPHQGWRVRNDLARRYFEAGEHRLAIEQLEASRALEPDREETWNYLILAQLALGDYAKAAGLADTALARGGAPDTFAGLRALADSAAREHAPAGSIRIRVRTGPAPAGPPEH